MTYIQWWLVAMIIVAGLVGGYYQLKIVGSLKEGKRASIWSGGWLFHPEYLDENGHAYRKKIIRCWIIAISLIVGIKLLAVTGSV